MNKDKIDVINYLDSHAEVKDNNIEELKKAFPEIDEFSLKAIESEWKKARLIMLNVDFLTFEEYAKPH